MRCPTYRRHRIEIRYEENGAMKDEQASWNVPGITPSKIEAFRKKKGLTQQELASALGVRAATVSDWEGGKGRPTGTARIVLQALLAGAFSPVGAMLAYSLYGLLSEVFREKKETDKEGTDKPG